MNIKLPRDVLDYLAQTKGDKSISAHIVDILKQHSSNNSTREQSNEQGTDTREHLHNR